MSSDQRWISIKERLPESSAWVLVYAGGAMNCMAFYKGEWQDWVNAMTPNLAKEKITHWMELPESPEDE